LCETKEEKEEEEEKEKKKKIVEMTIQHDQNKLLMLAI